MGQHFFVRGPSVSPNFGSPATFIQGLQDILKRPGERRIAEEKVAADKLFRDQTLAQGDRRQDFLEGAGGRTELLRVANLARENEKTNTVQGMAEGLQFAGADRFTGFESILSQDPTYAGLDDAGKLAARNKFIRNNPSALTPPKQFGEQLAQQLAGSGLFTGTEIQQHVSAQIKQRYPTADPSIIKSILAKPDFKIGADGTIGSSRSTRGGSVSLLSGQTNQPNKDEQVKAEFASLGLDDKRTATTFGVEHDDISIPLIGKFFKRNVTQQNYNKALAVLERDGNSVSSSIAALRSAIDGNLETDIDLDNLKGAQLISLSALAKKNEAQQTQIFNKRGGGISDAGQSSTGSSADIVNQVEQFNAKLLSRLTPRADSDAQVIESFLSSLGGDAHGIKSKGTGNLETNTVRQGGNQGGDSIVTPEVVANTANVDPDVSVRAAGPAEFQIGGPVEAELTRDRIFNAALTSPIQIASEAASKIFSEGGPGSKFIESLTPPGPGVLSQQPASTAPDETQLRQARQSQVDQLTAPERSEALRKAKALSKQRKISIADADGEGGSADEALLIAYFKYLEGQGG